MQNCDLQGAYDLDGPEDARTLYAKWADSYDQTFGEEYGYVAPRKVAELFRVRATGHEPVLDVGAGTGLLAEHLGGVKVDALDLSPEMLQVAGDKRIYRNLIEADLTKVLDIPNDAYGGVVSSGTFTHGHVGPECLPELLRIARKGARFTCGTIPTVFDGRGFGSALALLVAQGKISPVRFHDIAIYEGADHDHATDRALVMEFEKL